MDPYPPKLDPTFFGWQRNEKLKTLMPVGVPTYRKPSLDKVLKTAKCSYTLEKPYGTNSYSCSSGKLSCSIVCSCRGDSRQCCNDQTQADQETEDDDNKTDLDEEKQCQSILIFTWALFVKLNFIIF